MDQHSQVEAGKPGRIQKADQETVIQGADRHGDQGGGAETSMVVPGLAAGVALEYEFG